ncbi:MAG TPA: heme exporter protein CcmD [Burkholderiales bacterium]|nr:heme exporter protein CcmD [Burkholderiales bacterium]
MIWRSAAEFFAMGGYAVYVWGSYGVAACLLAAELWLLARRRRTLLRRLGRSSTPREQHR